MLRPAAFASVLAASAAIVVAGPAAAADPAPTPPPGNVSVQPVGLSSDGQGNPAAYHCGAQATAGGNTNSVQPIQLGSSGTSSPGGCTPPSGSGPATSTAGGQTGASGAGGAARTAGAGTGGSATTGTTAAEIVPSVLTQHGAASSGGALWVGLLLLLALLFALIGFAAGRRRRARAVA